MPSLVIRDIPPELHQKLKARAAAHHRSMNRELLALLDETLSPSNPPNGLPPVFTGRFKLTQEFVERAVREGRE